MKNIQKKTFDSNEIKELQEKVFKGLRELISSNEPKTAILSETRKRTT